MSKSVEDQLAERAEAAIDAVLTRGQRVEHKDKSIWRADLGDLVKLQEKLEKKARRAKAGGVRVTRVVPL